MRLLEEGDGVERPSGLARSVCLHSLHSGAGSIGFASLRSAVASKAKGCGVCVSSLRDAD